MSIETMNVNGFTVELEYDQDCESPRLYDNLTVFVLDGGREYNWPNESDVNLDDYNGWDQVEKALRRRHGAALVWPVSAYIHSGTAFSLGARTGQFADPWDSATVGLIYMTHEALKEFDGDEDKARKCAEAELEEYGSWANGECYGYVVSDFDGETVDSCWGFIGYDYAMQEAKSVAESLEHATKCNGYLDRTTGLIAHDATTCPIHRQETEQ